MPEKSFPGSWTFRLFFGGYWDLIETIGEGMVWFPIFAQMVTIYGDSNYITEAEANASIESKNMKIFIHDLLRDKVVQFCFEENIRSRKRYYCLKRPKFNILTALGYTLYENCGGKGTGMVGPQTVVSMYLAWTEMCFRH